MFTLLAATIAIAGSAVAQNSSYWPTKALYDGLDIFNEGLAAVGGASSSVHIHPHNTSIGIPAICYYEAIQPWPNTGNSTHAARPRCLPERVWVWDITYSDCPNSPLTFCYCSNAPLIPEEVVDNFALLPVGLRQEISAVIVMPEEPHISGNAYARGNSITYRLSRHDSRTINPTTAIHEAAHVLDYNQMIKTPWGANHYGFSESPEFRAALRNDTCYADQYALGASGFAEAWAQDLVLRRVQAEEVDPVSHWCIFNQMHVLAAQTDELLSIETCNERKQEYGDIIPINYTTTGLRRRSAEDAILEKIAKLPVSKKTTLW